MTALTAAEARIALLEAELETYKMYKSGEVLIDGTDYVPWKDLPKYAENHVKALREARHELKDLHIALTELKPDTLPRVITADAAKPGQWLAARMPKMDYWWTGTPDGELLYDDGTPMLNLYAAETIVLLANAEGASGGERAGKEVSPYELQVGDVVDVWHGDEPREPYYPSATIESASPLIADQFDFEGLERSFPRFQFRLLKRPDKKPDNPWFGTVYEDATHWAGAWRGTPVRPQSIRAGDLYDIHTAHGSRITGVVAARNGVRNPQNGDMYRLVNRKEGAA